MKLLSLLGEIDDLPLLIIELEVEAGIVEDSVLRRGGGLSGEGSPRDRGPAEVRCDFGKHLRSWIGFYWGRNLHCTAYLPSLKVDFGHLKRDT